MQPFLYWNKFFVLILPRRSTNPNSTHFSDAPFVDIYLPLRIFQVQRTSLNLRHDFHFQNASKLCEAVQAVLSDFYSRQYVSLPIFAFQLVEGYLHTRSKYKYVFRLFLFAQISQVPFVLIAYGTPVYWGHQNIMWTLLAGLICIHLADGHSWFCCWFRVRSG